jgi:hypothetical protein
MNRVCEHCDALHWIAKRKFSSSLISSRWEFCCKEDDVVLSALRESSRILRNLLTKRNSRERDFRQNICSYNFVLTFIFVNYRTNSRNANRLNSDRKSVVFQIQEELYHLQRFLYSSSNNTVYSLMNQSLMNQARSCAEHVTTGQLTEPWMRFLLIDFSFSLVLENRIFFTHSIRSMLATLNWMRSYRYRKKMNRQWSVSTSRHRSEDDKRQSAKNELWLMIYSMLSLNRSFLLVMKSEIIFRDFSYIWLRFLSLSVYSRCSAARERIEFKRFILLNLVSKE